MGLWFGNGGFRVFDRIFIVFYRLLTAFLFIFYLFQKVFHWSMVQPYGEMAGPRRPLLPLSPSYERYSKLSIQMCDSTCLPL